MSKKKPHAHPEEPDHGNMAHGGCQACNELIATLRDALRVLYAECKIICVKKNLRPHPDTMAEAAAALRLEDSAGHPASAEPAVCCSSCGVTLRGPGTIHYSDCPAPSFVMPVTAWRDLGYEGPLSHAQVVEALEQIDDYTPQAAAVAQTDLQLRADLAREKKPAPTLTFVCDRCAQPTGHVYYPKSGNQLCVQCLMACFDKMKKALREIDAELIEASKGGIWSMRKCLHIAAAALEEK